MNNPFTNGFLSPEAVMEQGHSLVKKTQQQATDATKTNVKAVISQISGSDMHQVQNPEEIKAKQDKDFIQDLYGVSKPAEASQSPSPAPSKEEDALKLEQIRKKLFMENYYQPEFNRPKREEAVTEKLEREEHQEMVDLQNKEAEKPKPMGVQMGQNRAERFPGASG